MLPVLFAYIVGIIFIGNAGEAQTPLLVAVDWALAVWFIFAASLAGWQLARR